MAQAMRGQKYKHRKFPNTLCITKISANTTWYVERKAECFLMRYPAHNSPCFILKLSLGKAELNFSFTQGFAYTGMRAEIVSFFGFSYMPAQCPTFMPDSYTH